MASGAIHERVWSGCTALGRPKPHWATPCVAGSDEPRRACEALPPSQPASIAPAAHKPSTRQADLEILIKFPLNDRAAGLTTAGCDGNNPSDPGVRDRSNHPGATRRDARPNAVERAAC